jgi:hypothetical protein
VVELLRCTIMRQPLGFRPPACVRVVRSSRVVAG